MRNVFEAVQKTSNDEEEHESRSHLTCKVENDPRPLRPKIYSFDGGVGGQLRAMSAAQTLDTVVLVQCLVVCVYVPTQLVTK